MLKLVRVCELEPWERYNVLHYPLVACADPEIFPEEAEGKLCLPGGGGHICDSFTLYI